MTWTCMKLILLALAVIWMGDHHAFQCYVIATNPNVEEEIVVVRYEDYNGIKLTYNPFIDTLYTFLDQWKISYDEGKIGSCPMVMLNKLEESTLSPIRNRQEVSTRCTSTSAGLPSSPNCSLAVSGPSKGSPCIFPFYFNTKVFYHCTNEDDFNDPNHPLWCSTQTDSQGHHIGGMGYWGNCDPQCNYFIFLANMIFDKANENVFCSLDECINYNQCESFVNKMHDIQLTFNTEEVYKLSKKVCDKSGYRVCCGDSVRPRENPFYHATNPKTSTVSSPAEEVNKRDVLSPFMLTKNQTKIVNPGSSKDGRWLPSPERYECSKDMSFNPGFIVRGKDAALGEFLHTVLLGYHVQGSNSTFYLCGGTHINRRYILTAAHCHDPSFEELSIREALVGEWDVERDPDCNICNPVQRFKITNEDVLRHEMWDSSTYFTQGNDIALVRLPSLVVTYVEDPRSLVLPACLDWRSFGEAPSTIEEELEKTYIVTGWGRTTPMRGTSQDFLDHGVLNSRLIQTEVEFIRKSQCQDYQIYNQGLAPNHICFTGIKNSDSCEGDSGGAVIKRNNSSSQMVVQSIVAFGTLTCGRGIPGIYTNVRDYIPWIIQNLRE